MLMYMCMPLRVYMHSRIHEFCIIVCVCPWTRYVCADVWHLGQVFVGHRDA